MLLLLAIACGGDKDPTPTLGTGETATDTDTDTTDTDTTEPTGACGDPINYDMTLVGTVVGPAGVAAPGVALQVEDRGWQPGRVIGTATSDAYGVFTMDLTAVTSVEGCWATILDYVLVGERTGERGELDLNTSLYNAIQDGTLAVDLGAFPLTLEATQ